MRLYVAIIILGLAAIATAVGLAKKPIEPPIQIDAQSPGVWGRYAAATAVPTQPDLVLYVRFRARPGRRRPQARYGDLRC